MSELTKEWLQQTISELEEERDAVPGIVNEDAAKALAAMKLALASLEANGTLANESTIKATQFKPVADLYEVTVPSGRSTTFTKDAAEASDCRVMGWSVQEYVKLERYQAAMLQGADGNSPVIPDGWVACSERMPEDEQEVITHNIFGYRHVSFFDEHSGHFFDRLDGSPVDCVEHVLVSHWMPLPAAPQQEVK